MNAKSFVQSALRVLVGVGAVLFLATCQSMAQTGQFHGCKGAEKTCFEVTLQYHDDGRVELVDSRTRQALPSCRICDPKDAGCKNPCKAGGTITDAQTLNLLKSHASPGCTTICNTRTGVCKEYC